MVTNSSFKHLAHDLNNIFTRILNSVELLRLKVNNLEEVTPIMDSIENGTFLASEMIDEMVNKDYDSSKSQRRININTIIKDLVNTFSVQLKEKVRFELNLNKSLRLIVGKYSDIYRVIMNLLINSTEAIDKNGCISISTNNSNVETEIEIVITDNGSGIEHALLPNIFNENISTKNQKNVSGLGLSIVKKNVENYHGKISVFSEVGKGTTFKIIFPALKIDKSEIKPNGKTILIAEDEPILCELLVELLQSSGYKTVSACNGAEVLSALQSKSLLDLLIIDRKMPEMDGLDCIKEIRKNNYNIPIILASGSPSENNNISPALNINKNISKPYDFEELLSGVRELIG